MEALERSWAWSGLTNLHSIEVCYDSVSAEAVNKLISNNPGLTDLTLTCTTVLTLPFFAALQSVGPALVRLRLKAFTDHLRASDFECIGRCCPALQAFELKTAPWGGNGSGDPLDAWLLPIAQGCTELRDLHLTGTVSAETIGRFVQSCTKLHTLKMVRSVVDDAMLLALASKAAGTNTSGPSLRVLEISWAVQRTETVRKCAPFLQGLESLAFHWNKLHLMKTMAEAILHLSSVRKLSVDHELLPEWLLAAIADGCPALRELFIPNGATSDAHRALAKVFAKCVHLETVEISDVKVSNATLLALAADGAGRKLRILECGAHDLTDVGLTALAVSCGSHLQEVSIIEGGDLTDASLKAFAAHCPALQLLELIEATSRVTVEGVTELFSACPRQRCVTRGAASLTQCQVYETLNRAKLPGRRKVRFHADSDTGAEE